MLTVHVKTHGRKDVKTQNITKIEENANGSRKNARPIDVNI